MGNFSETTKTVYNILRTLLMMLLVAGAGYTAYHGYALYREPQIKLGEEQAKLDEALDHLRQATEELAVQKQQVANLIEQLQEKTEQVERLELAMHLLKIRSRLARLTALEQRSDPDSEYPITRVGFVEINEEGKPIGELKQFDIQGDMVYVDYLCVTFDDKYIEQSDLDRSTAICLFQRIFGEHQEAAEGYELDQVGTRPTAYARGRQMSDFERKIWDQFWLIANDRKRASELGIHAAHGAAVSMRMQPGITYEIELRTTGNISIRPLEGSKPLDSNVES